MSEKMFTSKTAEVKSLIAAFMGQVQEEAERKDIVEYVQTHIENGVTDGVIAGAIKMMTADGEIYPVRRGCYVKGVGKAKSTTFEKIYNVCRRFQLDLDPSRTSRRSGTVITPTLGSMVQKGKLAACAFALDRQLKRVDLPTFGRPTMPHCKAIELSCLFRIGCLWPGAFLPYGQRLPHLRHLPRILYRKRCGRGCCVSGAFRVCGRRFPCLLHPLRRARTAAVLPDGNSPRAEAQRY